MKKNRKDIQNQIKKEKDAREIYKKRDLFNIVKLYDDFIKSLERQLDETT